MTVLGAGSLIRTGYTFAGWNTAANGSGTAYAASATFMIAAAHVTLYAQWTINTYTVTYNGNGNTGGTAPVDGSSPYDYNSTVTVLGARQPGQDRLHLRRLEHGGQRQRHGVRGGATFVIAAAHVTLYAQWTINAYTVTYNGNGNTGGSAPVDGSSPYTTTRR